MRAALRSLTVRSRSACSRAMVFCSARSWLKKPPLWLLDQIVQVLAVFLQRPHQHASGVDDFTGLIAAQQQNELLKPVFHQCAVGLGMWWQ